MKKLVIQYPPNHDGELHISVSSHQTKWGTVEHTFQFTRAEIKDEKTPWEVLVQTARDILDQHNRHQVNKWRH